MNLSAAVRTVFPIVLVLFVAGTAAVDTAAAAAEKIDSINASPLKEKGTYHVTPAFESLAGVRIIKKGGPYGKEHTRLLKSGEFTFHLATGKLEVKVPVDDTKEIVFVSGKRSLPRAWLFDQKIDPARVTVFLNDRKLEDGKGYSLDAESRRLTISDPGILEEGVRYSIRAGDRSIGNYTPAKGKRGDPERKRDKADRPAGCSISGHVLGSNGEPLSGAEVVIQCGEFGFRSVAVTDRSGAYSFEKLKPGYYSISFTRGGGAADESIEYRSAQLERGQKVTIDFKPLARGGALSGVVLDGQGKPIDRCFVSIRNTAFHRKDQTEHVHRMSWTDEEGFFLFENLPPGSFALTLSKEGVVCMSPGGIAKLEEDTETEVTVKIHPGTIRGKVAFAGRAPAGAGGMITLIATRTGDFGGPQWNCTARGDGSFEIQNLSPGKYELKAYAKGFYCKPQFFKIRKKKKSADVVVRLRKAGTILFKVTDRNGKPVDGLDVSRIVPGKGSSSVVMDKVSAGEFRVFSIEPGRVQFNLSASGLGRVKEEVSVKAGKETVVSVKI